MSLLVVAFLVALCSLAGLLMLDLAGGRPAEAPRDGADPVFAFMAGLLLLHGLLQVLDLIPLSWSRSSVGLPLGMLVVAVVARKAACRSRSEGSATHRSPLPGRIGANRLRPGWGDGVAFLSLAVLATFALLRRIANPDFIYHWGLKGKRFALAGGTDYDVLQRAWNFYLHPDYPNLVPELFATTALVQGRFAEEAMLLWAVAVTAVLLLGCRRLLAALGPSRAVAQATLALIALAVLGFSVSWQMTGNADGLMALAVVAAALGLVAEPSAGADLRVGIAAGLAAAAKIEGVAFAGLLVALYGIRAFRGRRLGWGMALRTVLSPALVILLWWLQVQRHGLAQGYYTGDFQLSRVPQVLRGALAISLEDGWRGLSLLALLLLATLLPGWRRARWVAALCALQLAFYFFVYTTAPADTELLVRSSFPRLMLHLVPTILVFAAAALERLEDRRLPEELA